MITELNVRSREIFRLIVESYLESGAPVGSKSLTRFPGVEVSSATIRAVMKNLEDNGLLATPHVSAGRLPTQKGLRLYVDGLMEMGALSTEERAAIRAECQAAGLSEKEVCERAGAVLSGLSCCAGLVVAPRREDPVREIHFVSLDNGRVLAIIVSKDGMVENRIMDVPPDMPASALVRASNYLNDRVRGKTLLDAHRVIQEELAHNRAQLDDLSASLVSRGIALPQTHGHLIVRGRTNLLEDVRAMEDIERARQLFALLEEQETTARLLDASRTAQGIGIFIGTENQMFDHAGWSMIIAPYKNGEEKIIGAIGVIGPTRIPYGRIIPIVDYTAQVVGKLLG